MHSTIHRFDMEPRGSISFGRTWSWLQWVILSHARTLEVHSHPAPPAHGMA
jgi:hypothetical protein